MYDEPSLGNIVFKVTNSIISAILLIWFLIIICNKLNKEDAKPAKVETCIETTFEDGTVERSCTNEKEKRRSSTMIMPIFLP